MSISQFLEEIRPFILEQYESDVPIQGIVDAILEVYNKTVNRRTLYRRLKDWGIPPRQGRATVTDTIRERIRELYFQYCLSDSEILAHLVLDGHSDMTLNAVRMTRRKMGLLRRTTTDEYDALRERLRTYFEDEKGALNQARFSGRGMLYAYVRSHLVNAPRDIMWEVYRTVHPNAVKDRLNAVNRRRGGFTVPGPNYTWSIDGYLKLEPFGFEIYAAIDAYSRYIVWFYVGISVTTARSVLAQYVEAVQHRKFMPLSFRADRGGETTLVAGVHYYLSLHSYRAGLRVPRLIGRQPRRASVSPRRSRSPSSRDRDRKPRRRSSPRPASANGRLELSFRDTFLYGKSIYNVKIERWWGHLCSGRAFFWRAFFGRLQDKGLFDKSRLSDRIAILYIYMPWIRTDFAAFVKLWNSHKIRKQANKPHVVDGIPYSLYTLQGIRVQDFRVPLEPKSWAHVCAVVQNDGFNLQEYIPESTKQHGRRMPLSRISIYDSEQNWMVISEKAVSRY
ncbi:hypothetical protein CONLIGDRAFT_497468 [Coniochaeta ligniaria NRRL 30616]|uniref:Integrase core domain-containing protein n=1 Tax=Coniochaeta ligniaria NRRL 30616 TaxID=1408157 RepID=A0A1J7IWN5_9PEZI|nr:hypothetical protein CONLIGDRAFT_497468 [Coniochaeta ligniaria NRRL 30616]